MILLSKICFLLIIHMFAVLYATFIHGCDVNEKPYITIISQEEHKRISNERKETPEIVILMADNRPLVYNKAFKKPMTSSQQIAAINAEYARTHGYQFRWYLSPCVSMEECFYEDSAHSNRYSSWAKILAINETLWDYKLQNKEVIVFYLDSDAYVSNHTLIISDMCTSAAIWEDEIPHSFCSGAMIFRNTQETFDMLHEWWYGIFKYRGGLNILWWEQRVLNNNVLSQFRSDIVMLPSAGWTTEKQLFWDNSVVQDGNRMNRTADQDYPHELSQHNYINFVKHMWMGSAAKDPQHITADFERVGATFLHRTHFKYCSSSSKHLLCLIHPHSRSI